MNNMYTKLFYIFFIYFSTFPTLRAELLLFEDFNDCELPQYWTLDISGNENAAVGVSISENPEANDITSIDGSCMVLFDDDLTGNGTEAWVAQLISPTFDASDIGNQQLILSMDIHFRQYGASALNIHIYDGSTYHLLQTYTGENFAGWNFDNAGVFSADITEFANDNMHLMVEYDDGGIWAWWAAVDNIKVESNLLFENFDGCSLPNGWTNTIESGDYAWQLGYDTIWTSSMNGSCMAFFNDDQIGEFATPSAATLTSPVFDGTIFSNIDLFLDVHYIPYENSFFQIQVFNGTSYQTVRTYQSEITTGWGYYDYATDSISLSAYRNENMQLRFVFNDAGHWAWRVGIDNIQVKGNGGINDLCSTAVNIPVDGSCVAGSNFNALFTSTYPSCVDSSAHAIWYSFEAPSSGGITVSTTADFNEVLTVFDGDCGATLTELACGNSDEFGFVGETLLVSGLLPGQTYFLRVSGVLCTFGTTMGNTCISISSNAIPEPAPANDNCNDAIAINLDTACTVGSNINAGLENGEPLPSLNNKSRASIWYSFEAPSNGSVSINSGADFADVLTVYSGSCGDLTEVAANDMGHSIQVNDLNPGETYLLQITAFFATVEGNVCVQLELPPSAPTNDICTEATAISVNDNCTPASNINASYQGPLTNLEVAFTEVNGSTIAQGQEFYRPQDGTSCSVSSQNTFYDVFTFYVSSNGSYTILNDYNNFDGFLSLYANNFDASSPCANFVAANDDYDGIGLSQLIVNLTAGVTYYVVTSGYNFWQNGEYTTTITGTGDVMRTLENVQLNGAVTSCDYTPAAAVWFSFVAPPNTSVQIRTDADFVHTLTLFEGICGELNERTCFDNPSRCGAPVLATGLIPGETYYLQVASAGEAFGHNEGDFCISVKEATGIPVKASIKAYLGGAYIGNASMRTDLYDNGLVPDVQPYYISPWNYNGEECIDQLPNNMVDWVLLELRNASDANVVVEQKAAILLSNGDIVDANDTGVSFFNIENNESYYIVVRHRNHVAVMSSVAVPLPNPNPYNFGADVSYAAGIGQLQASSDGTFTLHAGDMNSDGIISVDDFNIYTNQAATINTYTNGDCNLDRVVSVDDFNVYQPNASVIGIPEIRY